MSYIFGGLAAPGWTSPERSILLSEEGGQQNAQVFLQGAQLALQKQRQQLQTQEALQQMQSRGLQIQAQQKASWEDAQDQPKVADWFAENGTDIDKIMNAPMPNVETVKAQNAILNAKKAAAMTQVGQAKTKYQTDLLSQTSKLVEEGYDIPINPQTGLPDPAAVAAAGAQYAARTQANKIEGYKQLGRDRLNLEKERQSGRLDLQSLKIEGLLDSIDEKGEIQENLKKQGQQNEPQTKTLGDGTILTWMPNGKTVHVQRPNGGTKQLSPTGMLTIAKALKESNDPDADKLMQAAKDMAMGQTAKPADNAAESLPKDKSGLKKGTRYNTSKGIATWDGKQFVQ